MPLLSADDIIVQSLKNEGIKYIFGSPGDEILSLLDCIYRDGSIKLFDARHEDTGVLSAIGYTVATGEAAVCTGTVGPGIANMFHGMFCAWRSQAPVVAIVCKHGPGLVERHFNKSFPQTQAFQTITKWAIDVDRIEHIADAIQRAFRVALTPPMGPVLVCINENMLQSCGGPQLDIELPAKAQYHPGSVLTLADPALAQKAAKMLVEASMPLLLIDDRTYLNGSDAEMAELSDLLAAPIFQSGHQMYPMLPENDPRFWGYMGSRASEEATQLRKEGDLMLAVDCTFDSALTAGSMQHEIGWRPGIFPKNIIQIDVDPQFIAKFYPVSLGILGHSRAVLQQINEQVRKIGVNPGIRDQRMDKLKKLKRQRIELVREHMEKVKDKFPISPLKLVGVLGEVMSKGDLVVTGGAVIQSTARIFCALPANGTRMVAGGAYEGSLGQSVGRAMGFKLANPNRRVIALTGDGDFWWCNGSELETLRRHNLPITIIVSNNGAFGNMINSQKKKYGGRYIGTRIDNPDFMLLAQAYGMHGERVTKPAEIKPALERALNSGKPALVDVQTDPFEVPAIRRAP
jgi:acetolactate synthase-1/2/3 large subunit